ncbi:S-layer homology domain-containing protein [Candidatus Formimonas warabiya]|uniref:SLH domain-containing protein n=1 Tax=Formimonas warabiya TaxID=1761012 RepID=A0A3G1KU34_FORW1|nr:S-layer homology domain-containing protein [Candidatus Formimonas warabiya]ATW25956.1 hypothetical protein DCMF_15280 [Candidatus Formimonas warabiya]
MAKPKLVRICLMFFIMIILLSGSSLAASTRFFSDVPNGHWAERYIARMNLMGVAKGYDDGSFGINKPVNRLETVVMIIRAMGLESQAEGKSIPLTFQEPEAVPAWAKQYIAMGVIQGVISGNDLVLFRGDDFAKRYEVAQFIGKALGLEAIAPNHASDVLSYSDASDIPSSARGYVALLKSNGMMTGNEDGTFRPLENVTRGEFAVLMARLDEKLGKLPEKEVQGTVSQVTTSTITIKTDSGYETLTVGEDCLIFPDMALNDIPVSRQVFAVKTGFKALLIDTVPSGATEDNISDNPPDNPFGNTDTDIINTGTTEAFTGQLSVSIVSVNFIPRLSVTVKDEDNKIKTYPIADTCSGVSRNGSSALLKDIVSGDQATLQIINSEIIGMQAETVSSKTEGTVKEVLVSDEAVLTITDESERERTFLIDNETRIIKDGNDGTVLDLRAGDAVELRLESNRVSRIYAESWEEKDQVIGEVTRIIPDLNLLVISGKEDMETKTYIVFADADTKMITAEGDLLSRLTRLKTGDRVVIVGQIQGNMITATSLVVIGQEN